MDYLNLEINLDKNLIYHNYSQNRNDLGNTSLIHNTIVNPLEDVNRNVYLNAVKYPHVVNNKDNILKSIGYSIIG